MVRLASVEFAKLKNVRAGTLLTFPEAGAVLLGKNGTGKTTLLEYLVALCAADVSAFVSDEPFDVSATFILGSGATARLRLQGTPGAKSTVSLEGSPNIRRELSTEESTRLEYHITSPDLNTVYLVTIENGIAELFHDSKSLLGQFSVASFKYQLAGCVFKLSDILGEPRNPRQGLAFSTAMELNGLQGALCRHDEGLDYFRKLTDEVSSYLSLKFFVSSEWGKGFLRLQGNADRYPADLLDGLTNKWPPPSEQFFATQHTGVEFLKKFVDLCSFSGATALAPIEARRGTGAEQFYECKSLRFTFDLDNERISHNALSFGQKRLLSYLYYIACNTQIGIADELVNGMHHEWIDYCLGDACASRQMFYTSQNPLLLDFLVFQSEAEVSERFVTCKWSEQNGFIWENFDSLTGQEFFRLYKAGIQHVSDILRTKNWW